MTVSVVLRNGEVAQMDAAVLVAKIELPHVDIYDPATDERTSFTSAVDVAIWPDGLAPVEATAKRLVALRGDDRTGRFRVDLECALDAEGV